MYTFLQYDGSDEAHKHLYKSRELRILITPLVGAIHENIFYECSQLFEVRFEQNSQLETIGNKAFSKTSISTIAIPATVKEIGSSAFDQCKKLETVNFALENCQLESIEKCAFTGTSISTIAIPAGVNKLDTLPLAIATT